VTFLDLEREEAKHAASEELPDDDGPSRAEQNAELERDRLERDRGRPPLKPLAWNNWDAAVREQRAHEDTVRAEER
jgi:hypothetical protein